MRATEIICSLPTYIIDIKKNIKKFSQNCDDWNIEKSLFIERTNEKERRLI